MTDEVSICNLALQSLGAKSISTLVEDTVAGRACNRIYAHARDLELRAHPWSFARARVAVAASSTDPVFGYAKQYQMPSDCLRILPTNGHGGTTNQDDFQIEGRQILTNASSPIKLVYVRQVTDPNTFDQLFVELLVARIAMEIAEKVTQSNQKKEDAMSLYVAARKEARRVNAFERPPQEEPVDSWINARL